MTTPRASIFSPSASVIPDHDSVENEKDFASPLKKFKVDKDLVGEEHTTDSEAAAANELDSLEAFKIWCKVYGKEYGDEKEKQSRFQIFKRSLETETPFIPGKVLNIGRGRGRGRVADFAITDITVAAVCVAPVAV